MVADIDLNRELNQKQPLVADKRRKVIFQFDNDRPHASKPVEETLLSLEWEVPRYPACSPDIAPSDYHLFRSMQNALADAQAQHL